MKNAFKINTDGSVTIFLNSKTGTKEVLVSYEDYEKYADPFPGTWTVYKHQNTGNYYARGTYRNPETGKLEQPMLHKLLITPDKTQITKHINGNTLDNRSGNLINVPVGTTEQELKEIIAESERLNAIAREVVGNGDPVLNIDTTDTVPVKGVSFHKTKHKWEVSPFYEGKRYRLGYWPPDELIQANAAVTLFRDIGPEAYYRIYPKGGK